MKLTSFMLKTSTFLVSSYLIISMATASHLIEEKEHVRHKVQRIVDKHNSSSSRGTRSIEQEGEAFYKSKGKQERKSIEKKQNQLVKMNLVKSVLGSSGNMIDALLSQPTELYNSIVIGTNTDIILSAQDVLSIGSTSTDQFNPNFSSSYLNLFAENIVLSDPQNYTLRSLGGIVSANSLTAPSYDLPIVDVSGNPGSTPISQPGSSVANGGSGGNAGNLNFYIENINLDQQPLILSANGGIGGNGQTGDETKAGGNGGPGGNGGTINAFILQPLIGYNQKFSDIIQSIQTETLADQVQALTPFVSGLVAFNQSTPDTTVSAIISLLQKALNATDESSFNLNSINAGIDFQNLIDLLNNQQLNRINVSAGNGGTYGAGVPNGDNGNPGTPGAKTLLLGAQPLVTSSPLPNFLHIHPSQCDMLLAKAKLGYMFLGQTADASDVIALFQRVQNRTTPFVGLSPDSDIVTMWNQNEQTIGAINSISRLQSHNSQASYYLDFISRQLDYFGRSLTYVPLTSLELIEQDGVTNLLNSFSAIEGAYNTYYQKLKDIDQDQKAIDQDDDKDQKSKDQDQKAIDQDEAKNQITTTQNAIQNYGQGANIDQSILTTSLTSVSTIIDGYQQILPPKITTLNTALTAYKDAIKNKFNFSVPQLLQSLGQMAFSVADPVQFAAMGAVQGAQLLYNGFTTIENQQGVSVNKDYVINQITKIGSTLDTIAEDYGISSDGQIVLSDPGANKLITAEASLEDELNQNFYGIAAKIGQDLKDAAQDYVNTITARNNQILTYNATLSLLAQIQQKSADMQQKANDLNTQQMLMSEYQPAYSAFISNAYYYSREQVMNFMNLAARAYKFWSLDDTDILANAIGNTIPSQLNSTVFANMQTSFWTQYTTALGTVGQGAVFPENDNAQGIMYPVSDAQVSYFKNQIDPNDPTKILNLFVQVKPQRKADGGAFANMANVRLSRVRAWFEGATSTDSKRPNITLTITHTGKETIVSPTDVPTSFEHDSSSVPFEYNVNTKAIFQEQNFLVAPTGGASPRALIGPFTSWHVSYNPTYNPSINIKNLTGISLEFHGLSSAFK